MENVFVLRNWGSEQGLHTSDLLVEVGLATLASGTVEIPTRFENGQIVAVFAQRADSASVNAGEAYLSDRVVTSGAVTLSGPTGSAVVVNYLIIGRPKV